jgi:AraC-like DNA-binding protein
LYDLDVDTEPLPARCHVEAWVPGIPGIREVFHARMLDYAYPPHCHDTWAVLIVDDGAITYDLDRRERFAAGPTVTILPPGVPHDGRPAPGAEGFRKREFYLDETLLPGTLTGAAVDRASLSDGPLRTALARLHDRLTLDGPGLVLGAEAGISLVAERITGHLAGRPRSPAPPSGTVARQLREFLDSRVRDDVRLADAATLLDRSVPHLVRSFTREFGLSPYAYVLGRRIDAARGLLLQGAAPAEVAAAAGFYDQAHFTRHFKRHTSVTPAAYARSHARR